MQDFLVTYKGFLGNLWWILWLPINLASLDFTSFFQLRNQVYNQESNQAINQGIQKIALG